MFKIEAVVNGEQLETLLLAAKAVGVTLALGVALDEPRRVPSSRVQKRSTKKSRPKRYPASMRVKLSRAPKEGPPKLAELHDAIRKEFGSEPFRKGDVKKRVAKAMNGSYSGELLTRLMDQRSLVAA